MPLVKEINWILDFLETHSIQKLNKKLLFMIPIHYLLVVKQGRFWLTLKFQSPTFDQVRMCSIVDGTYHPELRNSMAPTIWSDQTLQEVSEEVQ